MLKLPTIQKLFLKLIMMPSRFDFVSRLRRRFFKKYLLAKDATTSTGIPVVIIIRGKAKGTKFHLFDAYVDTTQQLALNVSVFEYPLWYNPKSQDHVRLIDNEINNVFLDIILDDIENT